MNKRVVFDKDVIAKRVRELGQAISQRYGNEPLVCVCVLKGAFVFFADLMRSLDIDPELDFVRLASYAGGTSRQGKMIFSKDMEVSIEDKHVLIVEDVVDTGHSMQYLTRVLETRNPRSIAIAALVDKNERRELDVTVDFPGFSLDKGFIVGYGLDYDEKYRGLEGIYELIVND
ncbi:hypoxanthine phosphoribosyltransferase [Desulfoplanes formicivorans]|uniref:Hypoxanthine phosphoribosyltransferase n=1 Tax=Desulfoplanes formicivorans TaxID=1592317 RepID=A0A194AFX9_9BACT|nr:hypoxanthine phosphoribosyltransferase [Desulfoplanes formicivorans]GAU08238.1 hypoxanthine phosphoribosyltransferase [Desulfoplanes formicivorans]